VITKRHLLNAQSVDVFLLKYKGHTSSQVFAHVSGDDFGCLTWRANQQAIVRNGMGHFVGENTFIEIFGIQINGGF
jgi:hypothetical protein